MFVDSRSLTGIESFSEERGITGGSGIFLVEGAPIKGWCGGDKIEFGSPTLTDKTGPSNKFFGWAEESPRKRSPFCAFLSTSQIDHDKFDPDPTNPLFPVNVPTHSGQGVSGPLISHCVSS